MSKIAKAWYGKHWACRLLVKQWPLIINTVTGAGLFLLGDFIEQKMEMKKHRNQQFDWDRFKRIGIIGLAEAPPHFFFYKYLDIFFPGRGNVTIMKKIMVDCFITSPCFSIQFFVGMSLLEGKSWADSWHEFIVKFPTVFVVDMILWPPFQVVNFYLVPSAYRVLYVNCVTVLWNIFLSYVKHYDQRDLNIPEPMASIAHAIQDGNLDALFHGKTPVPKKCTKPKGSEEIVPEEKCTCTRKYLLYMARMGSKDAKETLDVHDKKKAASKSQPQGTTKDISPEIPKPKTP